MVAHAFSSCIQAEAEAVCEVEASLVYRATSRLVPVSEKQKQQTPFIEPETM